MEKAILQKIEKAVIRYNLSSNYTANERFQDLKTAKGKEFITLCDRYGLSSKQIDFIYNM